MKKPPAKTWNFTVKQSGKIVVKIDPTGEFTSPTLTPADRVWVKSILEKILSNLT